MNRTQRIKIRFDRNGKPIRPRRPRRLTQGLSWPAEVLKDVQMLAIVRETTLSGLVRKVMLTELAKAKRRGEL